MSYAPPVVDNGNVHEIQLLQANPQGLDRSLQSRCVGLVKGESGFLQQTSALHGFLLSLYGKWAIIPSSETIFVVPGRLSVTNQDQGVFHA